MTYRVDESEFTSEVSTELQEKFMEFISQNADKIPKGVKINFNLNGRYGPNGWQVDFDSQVINRKSMETEILGPEITEDDWEYIFNSDNFCSPFIRDRESIQRFYSELRKMRENGNKAGAIGDFPFINSVFIKTDSPYRIVMKWSSRRRCGGDHYLARLW